MNVAGDAQMLLKPMADILDEQQLKTGLRQEGVFFAAATFIYKTTTGLGIFVAGVVIDLAGLQAGAEPGTVPDDVLTLLGWYTTIGIGACGLVAWWFARGVRLSRDNVMAIKQQLAMQN